MNKVIDNLYIGGVYNFNKQSSFNFKSAVIKLYDNSNKDYPQIPEFMKVYDHTSIDGGTWTKEFFEDVLLDIHLELSLGNPVYVVCAAGKSRSATIVLAYLCKYKELSLKSAWKLLKQSRPEVDPSFYLLLSLVEFLGVHPYLHTLVD